MKKALVNILLVIALAAAFSITDAALVVSGPPVRAAADQWTRMDLPTTFFYTMLPDSDIWDLTAAEDGTLFALVEDTTGAVDIMDGGPMVCDGLRWAVYPAYSDVALFKSGDGGYTWTLMWHTPATDQGAPVAVVPQPGYADGDSSNDIVFIATGSRYISGDPKSTASYAGGLGTGNIYRSQDGGSNFTRVTPGCPGATAGGTITSIDVAEASSGVYMAIVGVSSLGTSSISGTGGEGVYTWNQNNDLLWQDMMISNSMATPPTPGAMAAGNGLDVMQVYGLHNFTIDGCIVAVASDLGDSDPAAEPAGIYICFYDANDGTWGGDIDSPTNVAIDASGDYAGAAAIGVGTGADSNNPTNFNVFVGLDGCAAAANNDLWRVHALPTVTGPSTVTSCNVQISGGIRISDISVPGLVNDGVYIGCEFPSQQAQVLKITEVAISPTVVPSFKPPSGAWPVFVTGNQVAAGGGDGLTTGGVHKMVDTPSRGPVYNGVGLIDDIAVSEDVPGYASPYYDNWCLAEAVSEEVSPAYDSDGLIYIGTYTEWAHGLSLWRLSDGRWERIVYENIAMPTDHGSGKACYSGKEIMTNAGDNTYVNNWIWVPRVVPQFSADRSIFLLGGRDDQYGASFQEMIWYSPDGGDAWTALPQMPLGAAPVGSGLSESGWCVIDSNTIFAGDIAGWIYKTTNRGMSWSDGALTAVNTEITSIAASPVYSESGDPGTDKCLLVGAYGLTDSDDEVWLSQDGAVCDLENIGDELYYSPAWGTHALGTTIVNFDKNWYTNHIIYAAGGGWLDRWQLADYETGLLNRISVTDAAVVRTVVDVTDPPASTWEYLWNADDWNTAAPQPQQYSGMALGDTTCRIVTPCALQIGPDGTIYVAFSILDYSYNNEGALPSPKSNGRFTCAGLLRCLDGTAVNTEWDVMNNGLGPWDGFWLNRAVPGSTHLISLTFDWKEWRFKLAFWEDTLSEAGPVPVSPPDTATGIGVFVDYNSVNVSLEWQMLDSAELYGWQVSDNSAFTSFVSGTTSNTTAAVTDLEPASTYYWRVRVIEPSLSPWSTIWSFTTVPNAIVTFPDLGLEAAIRDAIGKPSGDIYQSDLAGLTNLDASERSISDLTGLEHCTNLIHLNLEWNQISDISALSGLTSLSILHLENNQISDISALSGLTSLSILHLGNNQISDISALSGLTNLTELFLDNNQISDITPLSGLTNLTVLLLGVNQISDVTPLSGLTSLTSLNLDFNQISGITPLSGLTGLTLLFIVGNHISDITPLSSLTSLKLLCLCENQISNITPLSGLTNLSGLSLYSNQISDLSALSGLTSLKDVFLWDNQISDVSALSGLTSLQQLYLYDNQLSNLQPLVDNNGIDAGDTVALDCNPLNSVSINIHIPDLVGRGVVVSYSVPPSAPSLSSPSNGATIADTTPLFTWSAVEDAANYNLQVAADPGFGVDDLLIVEFLGAVTAYEPNAELIEGTYYWRVAAVGDCGPVSDWSETWSFTIPNSWTVSMQATTPSEGSNPNLAFGTCPGATDGFDSGIDTPHPPIGQGNSMDAYFSISDDTFDKLDKDSRAPNAFFQWDLRVISDYDDITLSWDSGAMPPAMMFTGTQTIDMQAQSSIVLPSGSYNIIISLGMQIDLSLKSGWNMVSVPVYPVDPSCGAVFQGAAAVYAWDPVSKSYVHILPEDTIYPDKGYWVAVMYDTIYPIFGLPVYEWTSSITKGWNLIGSVIDDADFTGPSDNPDQSVEPFAYTWDTAGRCYRYTQTIASGQGAWIAATRDCDLTLGAPPDTAGPKLIGITWSDVDLNSEINPFDQITFSFNEAIDPDTITTASVNTVLDSTAPGASDYGTSSYSVLWNAPFYTELTVVLGYGENIAGEEWVNPTNAVKDQVGNADATAGAGIQIPGLVLSLGS